MAPLSEVLYLIQGADPTPDLSGFSTPSCVPFSLTAYTLGSTLGPTPTPAVALVLDSEATVTGYWSDGSANVKVTVSLRNEGNLQLSSPVQVAVTCSQDGEAVDDCDGVMRVALPDGFSPGSGALTLQVPKGEVSFEFDYSGDEPTTLEINVAERIVGVDRDVWKCFSDTVDWDGLTPQELVRCAGWHSAEVPIQKWDRASPVKVWASGPESFIGVFKNVLDDLGPVLGLEFEWVSTEAEAEFVADIGYTLEGGAYYADPNEVGVATIGDANGKWANWKEVKSVSKTRGEERRSMSYRNRHRTSWNT